MVLGLAAGVVGAGALAAYGKRSIDDVIKFPPNFRYVSCFLRQFAEVAQKEAEEAIFREAPASSTGELERSWSLEDFSGWQLVQWYRAHPGVSADKLHFINQAVCNAPAGFVQELVNLLRPLFKELSLMLTPDLCHRIEEERDNYIMKLSNSYAYSIGRHLYVYYAICIMYHSTDAWAAAAIHMQNIIDGVEQNRISEEELERFLHYDQQGQRWASLWRDAKNVIRGWHHKVVREEHAIRATGDAAHYGFPSGLSRSGLTPPELSNKAIYAGFALAARPLREWYRTWQERQPESLESRLRRFYAINEPSKLNATGANSIKMIADHYKDRLEELEGGLEQKYQNGLSSLEPLQPSQPSHTPPAGGRRRRSSGARATFNKMSVKELRTRAGSGRKKVIGRHTMKKAELVNALCKRMK